MYFNLGIKFRFIKIIRSIIRKCRLHFLTNPLPINFITSNELINKDNSVVIKILANNYFIDERPPILIDNPITKRFTKLYHREVSGQYVLQIPNGKVFGNNANFIISSNGLLISDLSREFGAEGGRNKEEYSIMNSILLAPKIKKQKGVCAVISTCGSDNFHHWNYDILPRFEILKQANLLEKIDHFVINYKGYSFQKEGLYLLGIDESMILNTNNSNEFFLQCDNLIVPSLPQSLATISPFVISFLRKTFLISCSKSIKLNDRIFIGRKYAKTRNIINHQDVKKIFDQYDFVEIDPEDYSMTDFAYLISHAKSIASVHGSGLSNLAFISAGTKVLDIMAPLHQDPYYWMITNQCQSFYVALFAEGIHPDDDFDLVKNKVDNDLYISLSKLEKAINEII